MIPRGPHAIGIEVPGRFGTEIGFALLFAAIGVLGVVVAAAALTGDVDDRLSAFVIGVLLAAIGGGFVWWVCFGAERRIDVFEDRIVTHRLIGSSTQQCAPFVAANLVATPMKVPRSSLEITRWSVTVTDCAGGGHDIDPDIWWSSGRIDPTGSETGELARRLRQMFASNAPATPGTLTVRTSSNREATIWGLRDPLGSPMHLLITAEPVAGRRVNPMPAAEWLTGNASARIVAVVADRTLVFIDLSDSSVGHVRTEYDIDRATTTSNSLHLVGRRPQTMKRVAATMTQGWPIGVPSLPAADELERAIDLARRLADDGDDRWWNLVVARALRPAHDQAAAELDDHELGSHLAPLLQRLGERLREPGFGADAPDADEGPLGDTIVHRTPPNREPIVIGEQVRVRLDNEGMCCAVVRGVAPWAWILVETEDGDHFVEVVLNRSAVSWSRLFTFADHIDVTDLEAVDRIVRELAHRMGDVDAVDGIGQMLATTSGIERLDDSGD